ncbi:Argininosuccinate lyase [Thalassovita gelatinovora]|uniref:Argininosuccinate lyase n=1 Tax=Thalassovita gelatinovora TaxID=53501 RepID=A0A0P1FJ85_THAGE|nr:tripartite tricarboxylate transporter substrate binding protein [Thalassovita gelatinovora]QIZ81619.1 tripartite tricarboxylate transporter substrate binding protein [Thalassovita gelatinovora]CUH68079.1 Argininosuccinate lyase [Thalassovita gelatinovora]SEQ28827.1 Tripartite-type tricarboxylate transporter, receptor component TctC [Thalassovita gelatinovora]
MFTSMARKSLAALAVTATALAASMSPAQAEYPEKPVTMVIPLGAGGSHDLNARIITSVIPSYLGQAMIVRLTPGAGGQKGTQEVARAPADGYTLLFTHNYIDMLQQYVENVPYEPLKDFVPIARVNYAPASVIVRSDSPYQTFQDFVDDAKANPGKVQLSHSGNWGAFFVPAALMMKKLDLSLNLVPHQGGGPAMQALLAGDSDISLAFPSAIGELLKAGKIRVLATAGTTRIYDDVPTLEEVGVDGDIGFMHRFVLAPAGTPPEALEKLSAAFADLSKDATFTKLMARLGESVDPMTGPEYQALRESQATAYHELVNDLTSQ